MPDGARRVFTNRADIACTKRDATRREVFGESHEGWAASFSTNRSYSGLRHHVLSFLLMDDSPNELLFFLVWPLQR